MAYIHRKYRTGHEESDSEHPEARGPLFISVMPPRNFPNFPENPEFGGAPPLIAGAPEALILEGAHLMEGPTPIKSSRLVKNAPRAHNVCTGRFFWN